MLQTGVDILRIQRLERQLERTAFITRVYGPQEQELLRESTNPILFMASRFAAKEAFAKALGTGVRRFRLCDVEILRDNLGKPYIHLSGNAATLAAAQGLSFSISISHETDYVIAFVVAWQEPNL